MIGWCGYSWSGLPQQLRRMMHGWICDKVIPRAKSVLAPKRIILLELEQYIEYLLAAVKEDTNNRNLSSLLWSDILKFRVGEAAV